MGQLVPLCDGGEAPRVRDHGDAAGGRGSGRRRGGVGVGAWDGAVLVGLALVTHVVILQSKPQLITTSTFRVTNLTPPGSGNPACWGSNELGQSTPPGVGQGVTLPWRAWPALPDTSGSGLAVRLALFTT
jgi:hypothetical protein